MKSIIVASHTQAKIDAAYDAFIRVFPDQQFMVNGVAVNTGISVQPMSSDETLTGACNRVNQARLLFPDADYFIGEEAGQDGEFTFAWIVIEDKLGRQGQAKSAAFKLPAAALIELIAVMSLVIY
nr:DUF84 family protein [Shewanella marina]